MKIKLTDSQEQMLVAWALVIAACCGMVAFTAYAFYSHKAAKAECDTQQCPAPTAPEVIGEAGCVCIIRPNSPRK